MRKTLYRLLYIFNGKILFWIPSIIIANSKLYESGDEYCTLRADGWVTVRSKKHPHSRDMIPVNMVSEYVVIKLLESRGVIKEKQND